MSAPAQKLRLGDEVFTYEIVADNYVAITRYARESGALTFEDGKCYVNIPETVEGLPVLLVEPLYLNVSLDKDRRDSYAHNGSCAVVISLPEYASFQGLERVHIDNYSTLTPAYRLIYRLRQEALMTAREGGVLYVAKARGEDCEIIFMSTEHTNRQDNVWDAVPKDERLALRLPASVAGRTVTAIAAGASRGVYGDAPTALVVPDAVETIGADNFSGFPYLAQARLGRALRSIGEGCFNFYEQDDRERLKKVPPLTVSHYGGVAPAVTETTFARGALAYDMEDYKDWGYRIVGEEKLRYAVEFVRVG